MQKFLRLESVILPSSQIKSVTTPTLPSGEQILEVAILALNDPFKFDGQAAGRVFSILDGFKPAPAVPAPSTVVVFVNGAPVAPAAVYLMGESIPAVINIDGTAIVTDTIEWIDLATDFGKDGTGVELRLSTDAPGVIRQYFGAIGQTAIDTLSSLVPEVSVTA